MWLRHSAVLLLVVGGVAFFAGMSEEAHAFGRPYPGALEGRAMEFSPPVNIERDNGQCRSLAFSSSDRVLVQRGGLEARYCERMLPLRLSAVFAGGYDAPAERLSIAPEVIRREGLGTSGNTEGESQRVTDGYFQPNSRMHVYYMPSIDPKKLALGADWDAIMDLNIQAAETWEQLVHCNGGDAETARVAYARGNGFCKGQKTEDSQASESLAALHGSVLSFLDSTEMRNLEGATLLSMVHPLLTQVLLEIYASNRIWLAGQIEAIDRLAFIALVQKAGDVPERYRLERVFRFGSASAEQLTKARRALNTALLLQFVPATRCESWGLWPGLSRASMTVPDFRDPMDEVYDVVSRKLHYACGEPLAAPVSGYAMAGYWQAPALEEFKRMGDVYARAVHVSMKLQRADFLRDPPRRGRECE